MHVLRSTGTAAAFVVAVVLVVGCSGEDALVDVSGTVSYEGVPVEDGAVRFYPTDSKLSPGGGLIKDGKYTATKVAVGPSKVVISGSKVIGKKKVYNTPDSPEMPLTAELLPKKYSDKDKTELTYEVKRSGNEKNWELAK